MPKFAPSPEETGDYRCPRCGNTEGFIGYDDHGFPGDDCECDSVPCECEVTLKQPFKVRPDGEVVFQEFEGGGFGSEVGSYTRILCAACGEIVWEEEADTSGKIDSQKS